MEKKKDFLEVMLYLIITNLVFTKLFTDIHPLLST